MLCAITELKTPSDRAYLDALYRRHYPMLHRLAAAILNGETEAGDVVTNAMLSLFSKVSFLRGLEERERIGYLRATVRNAAFKHYNAQTRRNLTEFLDSGAVLYGLPCHAGDDPAQRLLQDEELAQVHAALATLTEEDRLLLYLTYAVRLPAGEVCKYIDAPSVAAVHMRLSRARRRVLALLQEKGWEHGG